MHFRNSLPEIAQRYTPTTTTTLESSSLSINLEFAFPERCCSQSLQLLIQPTISRSSAAYLGRRVVINFLDHNSQPQCRPPLVKLCDRGQGGSRDGPRIDHGANLRSPPANWAPYQRCALDNRIVRSSDKGADVFSRMTNHNVPQDCGSSIIFSLDKLSGTRKLYWARLVTLCLLIHARWIWRPKRPGGDVTDLAMLGLRILQRMPDWRRSRQNKQGRPNRLVDEADWAGDVSAHHLNSY
ncbi:hypothetical protein E2P81_ATG00345 [Venturia nashicola]|uniref:Uncharacterized protein n=1 Tax=Venturia nashicola TaxID=86259 RepID=A0A4Z1PVY3_9PEZI|nr:hypothetical protein E6O75_ATG00357 [Venturia nashicola]TLD39358.1 hypothetical protein E2P81_ATG00345 [Venturia nashicola]